MKKRSLLLASPGVYKAHQGAHSKVLGRERKREYGPGVLLLLGSRVEGESFMGSILASKREF